MADRVITVLGATGKTGRRLVERLRASDAPFRAASRSSATRFDWTDDSTWDGVVSGSRALYLVVPEDPEPVHRFVLLAQESGVERFVVLSGRGAQHFGTPGTPFGLGMIAAEQAVRETGASWTILRPNNFNQNFDEDLFRGAVLAGRLGLPLGDTPEPFVDAEDVADVAAALLLGDEHSGETLELSGPRALTFKEAASVLSKATGRRIEYINLPQSRYLEELLSEGFSKEDAISFVSMFDLLKQGPNSAVTGEVERVLGRPPLDFESYARSAAARGAWT